VTPREILAAPRIDHDFMFVDRIGASNGRRRPVHTGPPRRDPRQGLTPHEGLELVFWSEDANDDGERDDLLCVAPLTART
jgi:hypothetical protein